MWPEPFSLTDAKGLLKGLFLFLLDSLSPCLLCSCSVESELGNNLFVSARWKRK